MKKSRFSDAQIMGILAQAENGVPIKVLRRSIEVTGTQWTSSGPAIPNRHWPCERADTKGPLKGRHTGDISLCPGATLCAQNQDVGSGLAMALPQRRFQRRNGRGPQGSSGA